MKTVAQNPGNITGWQTDHDGKLRIATTTDGVNTSVLYRDSEEQEFKPLITTTFKETFAHYFLLLIIKTFMCLQTLEGTKQQL